MSKICPNCNKTYEEGKFCLICGTPLVENVASKPSVGSSLNLGDANAISGGVNVSDNHSFVQNTVNTTTNNVDSHNVINNHITQVIRGQSPEEIRLEKLNTYRKACQEVFQDGIQTSEEKRRLDDLQCQLGLDDETAVHIAESVRSTSARKSAILGPVQQVIFNKIKKAIEENQINIISNLLPQLKTMVQKFSAEDLQYTYYMLQAIMAPESCVKDYECPHEDKYWQTFWASVAYRRIGDIEHSEMLVVDVGDKWTDTIPPENVYVLATVNAFLDGDMAIAHTLYEQITNEHSELLSSLIACLYPFIYDHVSKAEIPTMTGIFYSENLFSIVAENRRKAEEEIARQKAEEAKRIEKQESARREKEKAEKAEHILHDAEKCTNKEVAFKLYMQAAELGNLNAQYQVGKCYCAGSGVKRSKEEGIKWVLKAAEQGLAEAQFKIGEWYQVDFLPTKDYDEQEAKKLEWYSKAAEQGHTRALYLTAEQLSHNVFSSEKDKKKVFDMYHQAAEQGDKDAQYELGMCYNQGYGVAVNNKESFKWLRKAAEQGHTESEYLVGDAVYRGVWGDIAVKKAFDWEDVKYIGAAAEKGHQEAEKVLDHMFYDDSLGARFKRLFK